MVKFDRRTLKKLSIASTVIDALMAFRRGRPKQGVMLLGAAALSWKVPGVGTAASVLSRLLKRKAKQ